MNGAADKLVTNGAGIDFRPFLQSYSFGRGPLVCVLTVVDNAAEVYRAFGYFMAVIC